MSFYSLPQQDFLLDQIDPLPVDGGFHAVLEGGDVGPLPDGFDGRAPLGNDAQPTGDVQVRLGGRGVVVGVHQSLGKNDLFNYPPKILPG